MADPVATARDEEIRARARELVLDLAPLPDPDAGRDAELTNDLDFDSLRLLELATALEHELGHPVSQSDAANVKTIGDVQDLAVRLLGSGRRPAEGS